MLDLGVYHGSKELRVKGRMTEAALQTVVTRIAAVDLGRCDLGLVGDVPVEAAVKGAATVDLEGNEHKDGRQSSNGLVVVERVENDRENENDLHEADANQQTVDNGSPQHTAGLVLGDKHVHQLVLVDERVHPEDDGGEDDDKGCQRCIDHRDSSHEEEVGVVQPVVKHWRFGVLAHITWGTTEEDFLEPDQEQLDHLSQVKDSGISTERHPREPIVGLVEVLLLRSVGGVATELLDDLECAVVVDLDNKLGHK